MCGKNIECWATHLNAMCHTSKELRKVYDTVSIGVRFLEEVAKLLLIKVLPKRQHDLSQLLLGDATCVPTDHPL